MTNPRTARITLTAWTGVLALGLAACGGSGVARMDSAGFDGIDTQTFGLISTVCTYDGSGNMTAKVGDGEVMYVTLRTTDSQVIVNGVDGSGGECKVATTKRLTLTNAVGDPTSATRKIIIDYLFGTYALGVSGTAGIAITLANGGTETNTVVFRGTTGVDSWALGTTGFNMNVATDSYADVTLSGIDSVIMSTGAGADIITANGGSGTTNASTIPITVYAGDDNDTITGGMGPSSVLNGGAGNDTFTQVAANKIAEQFNGGTGTDTVSYALRTAALNVTIGDGTANDGDTGVTENDEVSSDVENVTGGTGNDIISAAADAVNVAHVITGGDGNDTLTGGDSADTISGGVGDDSITGGLGNDTMTGGAGTDVVSYADHMAAVVVYLDGTNVACATRQGASGEVDVFNTTSVDIENLIGGAAGDTLTGKGTNDIIWGGAGGDTIDGGGGNDTLYGEAGADTISGGTGDDIIVGGLGADTLNGDAGNNFIDAADGVADTAIDCGGVAGNSIVIYDTAMSLDPTPTNCQSI